MGLKLNGATSGSIEIDVPAVAGTDTAITIPATNGGEFIVSDSSGNIDLGPLDINGGASDDSVNIDGSGRLLVGTSTARANFFNSTESTKLQVEGTVTSDSSISVVRNSNSSGYPFIAFGKTRGTAVGSNTVVQSGDAVGGLEFMGSDGTEFVPAGSIRCEVDGTPGANDMPGRLVFSTTADGASSPTVRMKINKNGTIDTVSTGGCLDAGTTLPASTSYYVYRGRHSSTAGSPGTSGTVSFTVLSNGNVQNTNNSYGSISDIKLKENIEDASSQWSDLKAIQVRNYNFKEETGHETHTQLGVVAQEIELVSPGLVTESPDVDEEGNDLGTTTKSVNYSVLYMKAVKALQEAMERIETLETTNASQAATIAALDARLTALEGGAS
jgi:hypothetical protein